MTAENLVFRLVHLRQGGKMGDPPSWLVLHWDVLFSGIGTTILAAGVGHWISRRGCVKTRKSNQKIQTGDQSSAVQVGGNVHGDVVIKVARNPNKPAIHEPTFAQIVEYDPELQLLIQNVKINNRKNKYNDRLVDLKKANCGEDVVGALLALLFGAVVLLAAIVAAIYFFFF